MYGAAPHITDALTALAKETKARGWWHSYGDAVPDWFQPYVGEFEHLTEPMQEALDEMNARVL